MSLRVPKGELPTELREILLGQLGEVPEPDEVLSRKLTRLDVPAELAR
ncbi:hypothetical protein [Streptomyces violaceusniger]|uniref:Uncharacterized protein n=1 Tax=Streptomyces violaceusniger (strain Tu 4113) TaxID=653045 RepID=G2P4S1_STRV4|nr:hypothetical protein Strvi_4309 [Streptomyces violaceusniger Tu 4113]